MQGNVRSCLVIVCRDVTHCCFRTWLTHCRASREVYLRHPPACLNSQMQSGNHFAAGSLLSADSHHYLGLGSERWEESTSYASLVWYSSVTYRTSRTTINNWSIIQYEMLILHFSFLSHNLSFERSWCSGISSRRKILGNKPFRINYAITLEARVYFYKMVQKKIFHNFRYPYDTSKSPAYELTYIHQVTALIIAAFLNVGKDTLVTTLIAQCRCRLQLLSLSLKTLCRDLKVSEKKVGLGYAYFYPEDQPPNPLWTSSTTTTSVVKGLGTS